MNESVFVLKTALATAVLVLLLQVKVGELTLEDRTHQWLQTSSLVGQLQAVADSTIFLTKKGINRATQAVNESTPMTESKAAVKSQGNRLRKLVPERSKAYAEAQKSAALEATEEATESAADSMESWGKETGEKLGEKVGEGAAEQVEAAGRELRK